MSTKLLASAVERLSAPTAKIACKPLIIPSMSKQLPVFTAIEQIKQGLNQVSSVVQTNAATAEENSSTSEEMSAQAATLREEVEKFKLDTGHENDRLASISLFREPAATKKPTLKASSTLGKH